jgi:multidrug efflux pump subunit AcrA (membrane-fusion protein)
VTLLGKTPNILPLASVKRKLSGSRPGCPSIIALIEGGVVHLRKINVARDFGTQIEVRDGVKAGDQVVLNPTVDLADGSHVTTRKPAT